MYVSIEMILASFFSAENVRNKLFFDHESYFPTQTLMLSDVPTFRLWCEIKSIFLRKLQAKPTTSHKLLLNRAQNKNITILYDAKAMVMMTLRWLYLNKIDYFNRSIL